MQTKNLFKTFFYLRCYTIVRYSDIVESGVKGRLLEKFGKLLEKFSKIRIYSTMRGWEENVYFRLENMFKIDNKIMILIWRMCPRLTLRQLWTKTLFLLILPMQLLLGEHTAESYLGTCKMSLMETVLQKKVTAWTFFAKRPMDGVLNNPPGNAEINFSVGNKIK